MLASSLRTLTGRLSVSQLTNTFRTASIAVPTARHTSSSSSNNAAAAAAAVLQTQQSPLIPVEQAKNSVAICKSVFDSVNTTVAEQREGRLFAVVHLCGKQFKVTAGDIILVEGYWPPSTGDQLVLDKVLVAGGADFTLVGRPLLQKGLVDVQATVIEKTLTHTKTNFRKKRRKQYLRINFHRSPNTMLMINSVRLVGEVNGAPAKPEEVRIF